MSIAKSTLTSRKEAMLALARMKALIDVVEDDHFLQQVLTNADAVVNNSGLADRLKGLATGPGTSSSTTESSISLAAAVKPTPDRRLN